MTSHLLGAELLTSAAPVISPEAAVPAATGVSSLAWLLLLIPVLGAVVLLVGGRRLDKVGHIIGCATVIIAFVLGLAIFFATTGGRGRPGAQAAPVLLVPVRLAQRRLGAPVRPAVADVRAADHRGRVADPHLFDRLHVPRPGPPEVLRAT